MVTLVTPVLVSPKKVEAIVITGGWLPQLDVIIGTTAAETNHDLFKWTQSFVLEALKKRVLDLMVDEIVNWVKGNGDPKFVTDWQEFLSDAGNVAAGDFAQSIGLADLCSPFKAKLQVYYSPKSSSGSNTPVSCTLDDIVGNVKGFADDFSRGGWIAYRESWNPRNNLFGAYILTKSSQVANIEAAQTAAQNEALAGGGFLSQKSCVEDPASNSADLDHDGKKGDIASQCSITTPGKAVGDLVQEALGADFKFIAGSQQIAAYVAEIADALFNRLIREGVGGLQHVATKHSPGSNTANPNDDFIPEGTNGCSAFAIGSSARSSCDGYTNTNATVLRDNLLTHIKTVREGLVSLRNVFVGNATDTGWKQIADDLSSFITTESANRSAACISNVLAAYSFFSTPTPAGVAALAASISAQLQTIDTRIALLDTYEAQLDSFTTGAWDGFNELAASIDSQLATFTVPAGAVGNALIQRLDLQNASTAIHPQVLICQ